jgi:hypothetical protein
LLRVLSSTYRDFEGANDVEYFLVRDAWEQREAASNFLPNSTVERALDACRRAGVE